MNNDRWKANLDSNLEYYSVSSELDNRKFRVPTGEEAKSLCFQLNNYYKDQDLLRRLLIEVLNESHHE